MILLFKDFITMKSAYHMYLLVLLMFVFSGCGGSVYFKTLQNNEYFFDKADPIYILEPKDTSVEIKNFVNLLRDALEDFEFNVQDNASCSIAFNLEEPTYQYTGSYTTHSTSTVTTRTSGFVGGKYVTGTSTSTISTPQTNYYTYNKTYKKIYFNIGCLENGKFIPVWDGFASTLLNVYNENTRVIIDGLISLIGTDFKGEVYISDLIRYLKGEDVVESWSILDDF